MGLNDTGQLAREITLIQRTVFSGSKLLGDGFAPEAEDFAVDQRDAVD